MEIKEIQVERIKPDKNQPRKDFDKEKLKEMSETFKTQGTIQPIEIDEHNIIITGELRYRASKLAGLKTIPCKIIEGLSPEQKLERQLVENFNRQDMRLVDSIDAVKKFMKHLKADAKYLASGHGNQLIMETAKRLGISREWLSQNLKFDREAPPELKKAVKEEKMTISQATEIMKLPEQKDREEVTKEILEEAKVPEYRRIRELVKDIKQKKEINKKYDEGKKEEDKKMRIVHAGEIVATYRSELNLFMKEASRAVYKIKAWKKMNYSWFDNHSKQNLNALIKTTRQVLHGMLEEVEALEESIRA